jgi:hypothetical protein
MPVGDAGEGGQRRENDGRDQEPGCEAHKKKPLQGRLMGTSIGALSARHYSYCY